jgi:hypothetical protein
MNNKMTDSAINPATNPATNPVTYLTKDPTNCIKHEYNNIQEICSNCFHDNCKQCCQKCQKCQIKICHFCSYTRFAIRISGNIVQSGTRLCFNCKDDTLSISDFTIKEEYASEFYISDAIKTKDENILGTFQ